MILSVIIPIYNVSKYLEECIDSIINQSLKEIEIILVNDCSPDKNDELICLDYKNKDSRIIFIKHDTNGGVSEARNTGLKAATSKYVTFVDPDDFLNDTTIYEKIINVLENNDHINFVGFNLCYYTGNEVTPAIVGSDIHYTQEAEIDISKCLVMVAVCTKVFRRKDLIDKHVFFSLEVAEDLMFDIEYYYKVKPIFKYIDEAAYMYRVRSGSLFQTGDPFKYITAYIKILEYIKDKGLFDKMYDYLFGYILEDYIWKIIYIFIKEDKSSYKESLIKLLSYYKTNDKSLDRHVYRGKYKIIINNKEKFQILFPNYKVKSRFYYKFCRVIYYTFRGIQFKKK